VTSVISPLLLSYFYDFPVKCSYICNDVDVYDVIIISHFSSEIRFSLAARLMLKLGQYLCQESTYLAIGGMYCNLLSWNRFQTWECEQKKFSLKKTKTKYFGRSINFERTKFVIIVNQLLKSNFEIKFLITL